jgi:hypothetical protein
MKHSHSCEICGLEFTDEELEDGIFHEKRCKGKKVEFTCQICGRTIIYFESLKFDSIDSQKNQIIKDQCISLKGERIGWTSELSGEEPSLNCCINCYISLPNKSLAKCSQ